MRLMLDFANPFSLITGLSAVEGQVIEWHQFPDTAIQPERFCVLNWNIAKQNHRLDWWHEFSQVLHHYRPHLFFFQEARLPWPFSTPQFVPADAELTTELSWYFTPNLIHFFQRYAAGVLTASTAQTLSSRALHSQHREPFLQTPKVALIAEYPIAGSPQTLLTINVHGINFVHSHKFQAQLHQIEAAIAHHAGPLILAGDFNTWHSKRTDMLYESVQRLNLQPVQFAPDCHQQLKRFLLSAPLDHVFYRGLQFHPDRTKVLGELDSSDHKPMVVTFSLSPTG